MSKSINTQSTLRSGGALLALAAILLVSPVSESVAQPGGTVQERAAASTNSELAQRHYRRANTYNNLERYDEALEEYRLAVAADPNLADAYRNLANIYLSQDRLEEAIPMLARFIDLQQEASTPLTASLKTIGELLRRSERYDEAIDYDVRAIRADPRDDSQVHLMGNLYDSAGHVDKAIRIYQAATEMMPDNAFMNRTLGRLYEREGRLEDALTEYRKAATTDLDSQFYRELVQNLETRIDQQMQGQG
ncbi:MAG: tetratricopeptide repeat protein [Pseudohongiella sp.]|uniref:tetratricopeptide repeat protein n=1 Tax=Pseudohongiella sp. TaxID=1979412 RepID=UPI0034A06277